MKLYALTVARVSPDLKDAIILAGEYELSSFSYFTRGSVQEMCNFCTRTFVSRVAKGTRQAINYEGHACHVYVRHDGLAAMAIADQEYPERVAYTLLSKVLGEFESRFVKWNTIDADFACADFPFLGQALHQYQDPAEADNLMKIQKELDVTKEVMHKNIEAVLNRGEKIDDLVNKSNDLNAQSKMFAKQAKNLNSCCVLL